MGLVNILILFFHYSNDHPLLDKFWIKLNNLFKMQVDLKDLKMKENLENKKKI